MIPRGPTWVDAVLSILRELRAGGERRRADRGPQERAARAHLAATVIQVRARSSGRGRRLTPDELALLDAAKVAVPRARAADQLADVGAPIPLPTAEE